ncbi:MAG TPA: hypothetical protein VM262_06725 [Acidimicrobiales bacterium]|nr:hypothetical protein [Acidimicrobiales bacterium]
MEEELSGNRSEDLARRAAELAARAQELAEHAREAGEVDDELRKLEADLAALDEEQARLDRELGDFVQPPEEAEPVRDPEEGFTFRLGNLGERIADIVNVALSSVGKLGVADVIERSVEVAEAVPVTVDSFAGSISVQTGSHGRVQVVAERRGLDERDLEHIAVEATKEADGVHITARSDSPRRGRHWVQLTVTVPPGTPSRLRTRGGSIKVDGTGAEVDARTAGGSIKVTGTSGAAELETAGGSIRVDDHGGPVKAVTIGGSIKLAGHLLGVDTSTIGGSIKVDGAYGPVAASTKGGSIVVEGRLTGSSSLDTAGGSIRVALSPDTNLEVDARGDSVVTDEGRLEKRGGGQFTIGSGEDGKLTVRAIAGSVVIRRA